MWVSLGPIIVINCIFFASIFYYYYTGSTKVHGSEQAARRSKSVFLSYFFKEWWLWLNEPITKWLIRRGFTPNLITFAGFVMSVVAGVFFALGQFGWGGWMMVLGATLDYFDGRVARLTDKETRSGAFFDSVMDRFGEAVCFMGLAWYFRESWILAFVIAALIGSTMVSYTRARGQAVGVDCKKGSMQRPERIVYMGVSSIFQAIATLLIWPFYATTYPFLVVLAILFMGVMTNATACFRMVDIMNTLDHEDKRGGGSSIPQMLVKLTTPEGREELKEKVGL